MDELVRELKRRLRLGDSVDDWMHALHYNDLRALRVRLANIVSHLGELQQTADVGGRKKSELYQSIRRMGELAIAMDDGRAPIPPAQPASGTTAAVAEPQVNAKKRLLQEEPFVDELPDKCAMLEIPAHEPDNGVTLPAWVELAPDYRPPPPLATLRLQPKSVAHAIGRNDFAVSVLDSGHLSVGCAAAVAPLDYNGLGGALALNTRLRSLVAPFGGANDAQLNALFGPSIAHGHRLGLTCIDFRGNRLGRGGGSAGDTLVNALRLCPNLYRLRLDGNELAERTLEQLVEALPGTLTSLSLSKCTDRVCAALAAAALPLLADLTLTHGSVGDAGVAKLCAALQPDTSVLTVLDVRHNAVGAKGQTALADAVERVPSLWWVLDSGNPCAATTFGLCSSNALSDAARRKMRALWPDSHPAVELHTVLANNHQFSSITPYSAFSKLSACLAAGADPDAALVAKGPLPLELALTNFADGRPVELLVNCTRNGAGAPDLHSPSWIVRKPGMSPENLRVLLEHGMTLSRVDGMPALVALATHAWNRGRAMDPRGWLYKFQLVLGSKGAQVNATDGDGETALSVLSRSCYADVVALLLSRGANPLETDKSFRNTCAHWCAKYGHAAVLRVLLEHEPALVDTRNARGQTPADMAKLHAHAEVELELRRWRRMQRQNGHQ